MALDSEETRKVLAQIDRDELAQLGADLTSIPSPTGQEKAIGEFILTWFEANGLRAVRQDVEFDRPNAVGVVKGDGTGLSLGFNGHTDTSFTGTEEDRRMVAIMEPQAELAGKIVGNKVQGLGISNMKGGVAAFMTAGKALQKSGVKLKGDVMIDIVIDEEVSGHGTLDTVIRGYTADAGISGETSELAVQPACIGRIWFEIEIQGKAAGIQRRYQGVSGIELGYKITKAVEALEAKRLTTVKHPLYPKAIDALPCMIGAFHAGNFPSSFPATCLLKGSMATVPGEDHEGVKRSLVEHIAKAAAEDPWMKDHPPKVRFVGYDAQASEIASDHPIVQTVSRNYTEVTGRQPEISGRQGAADTRFLNLYGKTPTVIFGPGSTAVMHSDDEYVSVEDYLTAIKVMALSIYDWCNSAKA
jgi:acetylornithine deacetylase